MISRIERELVDACNIPAYAPDQGDRQAFLRKLYEAVNGLDNAVWNSLSKAAQDWQYDATDVVDANAVTAIIPEFSAADLAAEPPAPAAAAAAAAAEEETDVPRAAIASKTNGRSAARPIKQAQAQVDRRSRTLREAVRKRAKKGDSVPEVIMRTVIKNPEITPQELYALVDKKTKATREKPELDKNSVNAIAYNTRRVLGHIKDLRKTNKNLDIDRR